MEVAWEEPEHMLDREDLFGSDKNFHRGSIYQIFHAPRWTTFFGPQWLEEQDRNPGFELKRGLYGRCGKLCEVGKLLSRGMGNREVSRRAKISKNTAKKYRNIFQKVLQVTFICECGKPATHQGWCSHRYKGSIERQKFIRGWHMSSQLARTPKRADGPSRQYIDCEYRSSCLDIASTYNWKSFRCDECLHSKHKKLFQDADEIIPCREEVNITKSYSCKQDDVIKINSNHPEYKKTCIDQAEAEITTKMVEADDDFVLVLDFTDYPEVFEWLEAMAIREVRTMSEMAAYIVKMVSEKADVVGRLKISCHEF